MFGLSKCYLADEMSKGRPVSEIRSDERGCWMYLRFNTSSTEDEINSFETLRRRYVNNVRTNSARLRLIQEKVLDHGLHPYGGGVKINIQYFDRYKHPKLNRFKPYYKVQRKHPCEKDKTMVDRYRRYR